MSALEKILAFPIFPPATYWVSSDATSADSVALKSAFISSVISPNFVFIILMSVGGSERMKLSIHSPHTVCGIQCTAMFNSSSKRSIS